MTVQSYGPVILPVLPADASEVKVTRLDGSVPTFTTPVTVDPTTHAVSFAVDDGGNPPVELVMRVQQAHGGNSTTVRVTLPPPTPPAPPSGGGGITVETDPVAGPAVTTERNRAQAAEASKASSAGLTSETSRATAAEQAASAAAASETTRAEGAESSEVTRAEGAESAETTRAEAAESSNAGSLTAHIGSTTAHPASHVSVNPSGLVVVTGTDVQAALAELDAWTQTRKFSTLTDVNVAGIADGQLPAWNAAAQKYLPTNPTGSSEVAYSENGTGVVTGPVAGVNGNFGVAVAIANTDIIVPPSNGRPIYLDGWAFGQQTTIGAGLALLEIWETTGAPVLLDRTQGVQLPNNITGNSLRNVGVYHQPLRIGPVAAQRSFQLRINTFGNGATPAWQVPNTNAVGFKPWLRAMAG